MVPQLRRLWAELEKSTLWKISSNLTSRKYLLIRGMATSTRKFLMAQVDVFTDLALTGNSLAVFLDGRGLSTEQMQALAREMNLSETTFILPQDPSTNNNGVRVRIFTVQEELPFAGHPTLGTAFVLRGA